MVDMKIFSDNNRVVLFPSVTVENPEYPSRLPLRSEVIATSERSKKLKSQSNSCAQYDHGDSVLAI